jgi:hypothetical protein
MCETQGKRWAVAFVGVLSITALVPSAAFATCPPCGCRPCWELLAWMPMEAGLVNTAGLPYESTTVCKTANPPDMTPKKWAEEYFHVGAWASDIDLKRDHWWEGCQGVAGNDCRDAAGDWYIIGDGHAGLDHWEYDGPPVDLTTAGTYKLKAVFTDVPQEVWCNPCWCEDGTGEECTACQQLHARCQAKANDAWHDDDVERIFTVVVYTGVWKQFDESSPGQLNTPPPVLDLDPLEPPWYTVTQGYALSPGVADLKTGLTVQGNSWCIRSGTVNVGTAHTARWRKAWRWVDGNGNICPCPADPKTFLYRIRIEGSGWAKGDADNGGADNGRAASAADSNCTLTLLWGANPRHNVAPEARLNVNGHVTEDGGWACSVSFTGVTITAISGSEDEYDSGPILVNRVLSGSVEGGGDVKEVICEFETYGSSVAELGGGNDHVGGENAEAQATLGFAEASFAPGPP